MSEESGHDQKSGGDDWMQRACPAFSAMATQGCPGCQAALAGTSWRGHSEACRSRMEAIRASSEGQGHFRRQQERENDKCAREIEQAVGRESKRVRVTEESIEAGRVLCTAGRSPVDEKSKAVGCHLPILLKFFTGGRLRFWEIQCGIIKAARTGKVQSSADECTSLHSGPWKWELTGYGGNTRGCEWKRNKWPGECSSLL